MCVSASLSCAVPAGCYPQPGQGLLFVRHGRCFLEVCLGWQWQTLSFAVSLLRAPAQLQPMPQGCHVGAWPAWTFRGRSPRTVICQYTLCSTLRTFSLHCVSQLLMLLAAASCPDVHFRCLKAACCCRVCWVFNNGHLRRPVLTQMHSVELVCVG